MKLYEIAADYRRLADMLEASETPEDMRQVLTDTLESIAGDFEDKAENMAALIAENTETISACNNQIARLKDKAARLEAQNTSIKNYMMAEMKYAGIKKVNAGVWQVSVARNGGKAPIIWDDNIEPENLPSEYTRTSIQINKDAVRESLEAGETLAFAKLGERGESLRIK